MKKSPVPDDNTTEMLIDVEDVVITELTKLANMMYVQGSFQNKQINLYLSHFQM